MLAIIGYTFAVLWSAGCVIGAVSAIYYCFKDESIILGILAVCLLLPLCLLLAALPWAFAADMNSPDLVTLKKNEFECKVGEYRGSGKNRHYVCDVYGRIGQPLVGDPQPAPTESHAPTTETKPL